MQIEGFDLISFENRHNFIHQNEQNHRNIHCLIDPRNQEKQGCFFEELQYRITGSHPGDDKRCLPALGPDRQKNFSNISIYPSPCE